MNVLHGSAGGLQATSPEDKVWNQDRPGVKDTAEPGELFGSSLGVGDFNNDGFADLAIGAPFEDVGPVEGGTMMSSGTWTSRCASSFPSASADPSVMLKSPS